MINDTSSELSVVIIFTSVNGFNVWPVFEPKYGQVHGGGNTISLDFELFDGCWCSHDEFLCFSLEFCRFFSSLKLSSSSSVPSGASLLPRAASPPCLAALSFVANESSMSSATDSSHASSFCSMRDKLLNRFRKPVPNFCDSARANDVHAECDARRFLYRRGDNGLQQVKEK